MSRDSHTWEGGNMYKSGKDYIFNNIKIKFNGHGYESHFTYFDDKENKKKEAHLNTDTAGQMVYLLGIY